MDLQLTKYEIKESLELLQYILDNQKALSAYDIECGIKKAKWALLLAKDEIAEEEAKQTKI